MMGWQRAAGEDFGDLESPKRNFPYKNVFGAIFKGKNNKIKKKCGTF